MGDALTKDGLKKVAKSSLKENAVKKKIETPNAPKAIGPYSQAVETKNFVFISGQIPIDPTVGKIVEQTIEGQTRQVLANIEAILKAAGQSWEAIVKTEIFLQDLNDFQTVNTIYGEKFPHDVKPARQAIQVARLPLDALIEISCITTKP